METEKLEQNVPPSLKVKPHWLVWKSVKFNNPEGELKLLKVPYYVDGRKRRGMLGSDSDRAALSTFDAALRAYRTGKYDGVGFAPMPEDDVTILDLDRCIDSHGKYSEFAKQVVESGTYVETSPSGRGLRAIYRNGALVEGKRNGLIDNGERVEIYCGNAFVTITGNRVSTATKSRPVPKEIADRLSPVIAGHGMAARPAKNDAGETLISPDATPLPDFTYEHARVVLSKLPEMWGQPGRGTWYRVAAALHAQFDGSEEAYNVLDEWSQNLDGYDPHANRSRWDKGFGHTTGRGGLTTMKNLVFESMHNGGLKVRRAALARWGISRPKSREALDDLDIDIPGDEDDDVAEAAVLPQFAELRQLADVSHMYRQDPPEVEWLVENLIARRNVAVLGGGSGTSKSFFAMQLTMSAAAGIEGFGGMKIIEGGFRTLYLAYEDTAESMHVRVYKLRQYIGERVDIAGDETYIDDLCSNFSMLTSEVLDSGAWVFLKQAVRYDPAEVTEFGAYMRDYIREQNIDLLVLDTGSECHTADENNASNMVVLMRMMRQLAHSSNCGILVIQHVQKGIWNLSLDEINQSSIRGSSVLVDKARNVVMLARMPRKDAPKYGLPDTHETHDTYVALKHVKANLGGYVPLTMFERSMTGMLVHRPDIREQENAAVEVAEEDAEENRRAIRARHVRDRILAHIVEQNDSGVNPNTTMIRAWAMENGIADSMVNRALTMLRVERQIVEVPDPDYPRSKCWVASP